MGPSQPLLRMNILCLQAPTTCSSGAKFVCSIKCIVELGSGSTLANTGWSSLSPFEANISLGDKYKPCFCSEEWNRDCMEQSTCLDWIYPPYLNIRISYVYIMCFRQNHSLFATLSLFPSLSPSFMCLLFYFNPPSPLSAACVCKDRVWVHGRF